LRFNKKTSSKQDLEKYGLKHQLKERFGKDDDHVGEAFWKMSI